MTANRNTKNTNPARAKAELGDDLTITKTTRRASGGGTWVCGTIAGYRSTPWSFPITPKPRIGNWASSRISKLWVARLETKRRSSTGTAEWTNRLPRPRRRRWSISWPRDWQNHVMVSNPCFPFFQGEVR